MDCEGNPDAELPRTLFAARRRLAHAARGSGPHREPRTRSFEQWCGTGREGVVRSANNVRMAW